jgi:magnesium-transporting ATPase (P-type)
MKTIDPAHLVVGDVVILHSGNFVHCNMRLVEAHSLEIDEAYSTVWK